LSALHSKISSCDVNPLQKALLAFSTGLVPFPSRPVRIESHRAGEAAPGYGNPRKSRWQSLDIRPWFVAPQKERWASLPPAPERRRVPHPRKSSVHQQAPESARLPAEAPCDSIPPPRDMCSQRTDAAKTPDTNPSVDLV